MLQEPSLASNLEFFVVRVDAAPGLDVPGGSFVTVESGPHRGLAQALHVLQHPKTRAHVLPDIVWLPSSVPCWAANEAVALKPRLVVTAETVQQARETKGGRGLVPVPARRHGASRGREPTVGEQQGDLRQPPTKRHHAQQQQQQQQQQQVVSLATPPQRLPQPCRPVGMAFLPGLVSLQQVQPQYGLPLQLPLQQPWLGLSLPLGQVWQEGQAQQLALQLSPELTYTTPVAAGSAALAVQPMAGAGLRELQRQVPDAVSLAGQPPADQQLQQQRQAGSEAEDQQPERRQMEQQQQQQRQQEQQQEQQQQPGAGREEQLEQQQVSQGVSQGRAVDSGSHPVWPIAPRGTGVPSELTEVPGSLGALHHLAVTELPASAPAAGALLQPSSLPEAPPPLLQQQQQQQQQSQEGKQQQQR
ncbi:hypothetical protein N2152v2_008796 [Parachlorella kessleri]